MIVREIEARSVLSASKVYPYTVNPYVGCQHACSYCYARYMKRFTGHAEPWGAFVDVKINAPAVLAGEIQRKKPARVWVSGVCDAYQPLEARYRLTRQCLQILVENGWPVTVQTRSPLVTRDIDLLQQGAEVEAGLSVTTADDAVRRLFEPGAPSIPGRLRALAELHDSGLHTFAMIAPLLPGAEHLVPLLADRVDHVLVDRLNYHYADALYRRHGLAAQRSDEYFRAVADELAQGFAERGIPCRVIF